MEAKRIVVAGSNYLIREGLASLIKNADSYQFGGIIDNKEAIIYVLESGIAEMVIIDYDSIDFDNPEEIQLLQNQYNHANILLLVNSITHQEASSFANLKIKNIVTKSADQDELLRAIEQAFKGKKYYSDSILDLLLEKSGKKNIKDLTNLTSSEKEIVKLIAEGLTTKEIALRKHVSFHTIMTHRKNIFRKLNVSNVSELMIHAIKAGWIENIEYYI